MEVYISINGVLRNFIKKFEHHYREYFMETNEEEYESVESFDYNVKTPIHNDDLLKYFAFQSKEEYENFCFIEFSLEIFGYSTVSYPTVIGDLNKLIYKYPNITFTIVGIDEFGKAKPSTLFFLSKHGFLGNNIRFIKSEDIDKEWKKCNMWITDSEQIIDKCPRNKTAIKFNTEYNENVIGDFEINNINKIEELCLTSLEKNTTSMSTRLLKSVARIMVLTGLMKRKNHHLPNPY